MIFFSSLPVTTLIGGCAHDMTSLHTRWIGWLRGVVSCATSVNTSRILLATLFCRLYMTTAHRSPFSRDTPRCRLKCPALITSYAFVCAYAWKSSSVSVAMLQWLAPRQT